MLGQVQGRLLLALVLSAPVRSSFPAPDRYPSVLDEFLVSLPLAGAGALPAVLVLLPLPGPGHRQVDGPAVGGGAGAGGKDKLGSGAAKQDPAAGGGVGQEHCGGGGLEQHCSVRSSVRERYWLRY